MRIVVSERAKRSREKIAHYIMLQFGKITFMEFCEAYKQTKRTIANLPKSFPVDYDLSDGKYEYHFTFINGLSKMVYRIVDDEYIFIADMWDVRQEPPSMIQS